MGVGHIATNGAIFRFHPTKTSQMVEMYQQESIQVMEPDDEPHSPKCNRISSEQSRVSTQKAECSSLPFGSFTAQ